MSGKKNTPSQYVCTCNKVSPEAINKAIQNGCHTLPKISTATTAGVGECGGSCRPLIEKMLTHYLEKGELLSKPKK